MTIRWLTLFDLDDTLQMEVPIYGILDASGNVIDPTFSTDVAHPRPWLDGDVYGVSSDINLIEGTASIGQFSVTVLDARIDPTDQATGFFTRMLAERSGQLTGYTRLIMRRAVFQVGADPAHMSVSLNGVVSRISLNDDLSSYTITVRDMNERARRTRLFNKLTGPTPRYTKEQAPERPWTGTIIPG